MAYEEGNILDEEIAGTEDIWDIENGVVGLNLFVLTKDTDVIKLGDGFNIFVDLEEIININDISNVFNIADYIDTTLGSDIFDKIAFFDTDETVQRTPFLESELDLNIENGEFAETSSVITPIINGPSQKAYGTSFTLRADSLSSYREKGGYIETFRWTLYDGTVVSGDEVIINIPDDISLVGTTWIFDCVAIDILGNKSKKTTFTMVIAEADYPVIDHVLWELNDLNPTILNTSWNNDEHIENNTYYLTIEAIDPNDQILTYEVLCTDGDVTITQMVENVFSVTYPEYTEDTTVIYTITVMNEDGSIDTETDTKTVINIVYSPIINSVIWDDDNHDEFESYVMTINAIDPQGQDLTYGVVCNDPTVGVVQSGTLNVWDITYGEYTEDTNISYTITVTNEDLESSINIDTKIVHNVEMDPVIDNLSWDNDIHEENESYQLTITAHDPQSQDLTYGVVCDDVSVGVVQSGTPNVWDITYGEYGADTDVEYTITVTNEDLLTDIAIDTKTVHNIEIAPIIDSLVWDDGYHEENESYQLTITAHDPQSQDLTYGVVCDDVSVGVVQSGTPNVWDITYGEYGADTDVEYTITVTNEDLLTDIETDNKTVHDIVIAGGSGVFGGGNYNNPINRIEYITIATPGNAIYFGTLTVPRDRLSATSNGANDRGIFSGGGTGSYSMVIDYITISITGNATAFGILTASRQSLAATSNGINERGVFAGGQNSSGYSNIIDYITIAIPGNAIDFGDLALSTGALSATSNGINERGIFAGGQDFTNNIDYITISALGNAIDFGDLVINRIGLTATSNGINNRGIFAGGDSSWPLYIIDTIDYITISTLSNTTDFGNLTVARSYASATSNGIEDRGVFGGGIDGSFFNEIDYITISTLGDAIDFGDLTLDRWGMGATAND